MQGTGFHSTRGNEAVKQPVLGSGSRDKALRHASGVFAISGFVLAVTEEAAGVSDFGVSGGAEIAIDDRSPNTMLVATLTPKNALMRRRELRAFICLCLPEATLSGDWHSLTSYMRRP